MSFFIKDHEFLEKYYEICEKVKNSIKKEFYSEPVYNEKNLRLKQNLVMEKSTQIFTIIKYQKKALTLFAYE